MLFCFLSCTLCLGIGVMFAWPSSTLRFFGPDKRNLNRPFNDTEVMLFILLPFFGILMSIPITGIYLDKLGRKYCAVVLSALCTLSWTMMAISNRVEVVLTAIFISGLSGAMFVVAPIYISEICQVIIRGAMTSGCVILCEIGMLVSYILGNIMGFQEMVYTCLSMSAFGTLCLLTLKDSPVFLMAKGMEYEAAKSIAFFRGTKPDSREVVQELNLIRRSLNYEMDVSNENGKTESSELVVKPVKSIREAFNFIRRSRSTRRALFLTLFLASATIFQGMMVVDAYTEILFKEMFPSTSGIIYDALILFTSIFSGLVIAFTIELAGRRSLMIYSSIVTGIGCVALATQIHLEWAPNWLTIVFLFVFIIPYTIGAGTVPFVVCNEVFLPEIKCTVIILILEWMLLCCFIVVCTLSHFIQADFTHGLGYMMYICAIYCFLTAVFCTFYQPETKGLPVDAIHALFDMKKCTHSNSRIITKNKIKSLWGLRGES